LTRPPGPANLPGMELRDLNADERVALVGLLKLVVVSNGNVSEDELEEVQQVADAFGEEAYEGALDAFEARFLDEQSFQTFLRTIGRQEARDLIYGTVLQAAAADAIEGQESEILSWLAEAWNIQVQVVDAPDEAEPA
jgi:hypothetical protein